MGSVNVKNMVFRKLPLVLFEPAWGSSLASTIIELERLRVKRLGGSVPPYIFFQLKNIFQMLESLGSARIEGNRTTLAEFIERVIEGPGRKTKDEKLREIFNIEHAIEFIEEHISQNTDIQRAHISEIHKILVDGLTPPPHGEGSCYPGEFRHISVAIKGSAHVPPDPLLVPDYVCEILDFVNKPVAPQHDLLITALSHHRIAWIHPFDNGNGRLVRMFTYALLIKQGFQVKSGRILNPTAVFCIDRKRYYDMLEQADSGEKDRALAWCEYVLNGLRKEMEKIDSLLDLKYLWETILLPAISFALERENINRREYDILRAVIQNQNMSIKSADIETIVGQESPVQRSRIIKRLKDKNMIMPLTEKGRVYTISFINNFLLRGIIHVLEQNGFIPKSLNQK